MYIYIHDARHRTVPYVRRGLIGRGKFARNRGRRGGTIKITGSRLARTEVVPRDVEPGDF